MNFSKWRLMYFTCTPAPHPGLKCTKNTTLWNHYNMCLYDTFPLWCYMMLLCDIDCMIHEGFMMQAVNDVVWCGHLVWIQYAACMYVVCMCLNDNVMNFFSVWCTRRMRRKSLYACCMKSYDVNMNVWRFREEMTEFREEMSRLPLLGRACARARPPSHQRP